MRPKIDAFTAAYLEAANFTLPRTGEDDSGGDWDNAEWSDAAIAQAVAECAAFYAAHEGDIHPYGLAQAGHDFHFTRNGHGVGFWENDHGTPEICERLNRAAKAAGQRDVYIGDDGLLYFFPGMED